MPRRLQQIILLLLLGGLLPGAARAEVDASISQLLQEVQRLSSELPAPRPRVDPDLDLALRFMQEERHLDALSMLREVVRREPDNLQARFVAATALIKLKRYDAARTLLEQLLEKQPQHPGLLNNLAWLYATATDPAARRTEEAVELARRALVIEGGDYHIWSTMAEAYFADRQFPRALRAAEEALRLAREKQAPARQLILYEQQVAKCREAVQAYAIFE